MSMKAKADTIPDRTTARDLNVEMCTIGGVQHDFRRYDHKAFRETKMEETFWRCVWCHALTCGSFGQSDPCWLPMHHVVPHRSRRGDIWLIGSVRIIPT